MEKPVMDIRSACRKIAEKGLVAGASGNVSERYGNRFRITASGTRLDSIDACQTDLTCSIDTEEIPARASMETGMHRAIYRQRPDVGAVIHANPPYSTLFACSRGLTVNTSLIPEGKFIEPVGCVRGFPAGSEELASAVSSAVAGSNVLILQNHGVVAVGGSLEEALNRLEYLELICRITITARTGNIILQEGISSGYRQEP